MTVHYEWVAEPVDEHGDIIDPLFGSSLNEVREFAFGYSCHHVDFALVRNVGNEIDGLQERQYVYLRNGKLPLTFPAGQPVPKRFHKEVSA